MYLTYEEYQGYGGTLTPGEFSVAEAMARQWLDYLTASRIKNHMAEIPEEIKLCIMNIITVQSKTSAGSIADNPLISSFNTDGYSESYGNASDQIALLEKQMYKGVRTVLWGIKDDTGTPLLWRGTGPYLEEGVGRYEARY